MVRDGDLYHICYKDNEGRIYRSVDPYEARYAAFWAQHYQQLYGPDRGWTEDVAGRAVAISKAAYRDKQA